VKTKLPKNHTFFTPENNVFTPCGVKKIHRVFAKLFKFSTVSMEWTKRCEICFFTCGVKCGAMFFFSIESPSASFSADPCLEPAPALPDSPAAEEKNKDLVHTTLCQNVQKIRLLSHTIYNLFTPCNFFSHQQHFIHTYKLLYSHLPIFFHTM
jgi:hypothetical protein